MSKQRYYTNEKNILILIALLKANGIKKVVASPGTTNHTFVASLQNDSFFEMYSSVDERSAAYIACGLAAESGEAVVITCTEATAARNYAPGLTEAYYRKLPILAVTTTHGADKVGHLHPQIIDHAALPNDVSVFRTFIPLCETSKDFVNAELRINEAILELSHRGGGPVIINVETTVSTDYSTKELPKVRKIERFIVEDTLPELPNGKIAVFIGSHHNFSQEETNAIDRFCSTRNAIVFCDHTSGYYGKYRTDFSLVSGQQMYVSELTKSHLLIHIGEVSGDYFGMQVGGMTQEVWRVNPDGRLCDTFGKLHYIFEMKEKSFFLHYSQEQKIVRKHCIEQYIQERKNVADNIPELQFSKVWAASQLLPMLPTNSVIHFSILGSFRAGNFFELPDGVESNCNVGGFGIDGSNSTLLGASLVKKEKLYYLMIGDLAFFYDLNAIGNRHLGNNVRILLVNNGDGTEFRMRWHPCSKFDKEECDKYMSAGGHYGNKSQYLIHHMAEDLGFEYLTASCKVDFLKGLTRFTNKEITDKPMLFEIFTDSEVDSNMVDTMRHLVKDAGHTNRQVKQVIKNIVRTVVGESGLDSLKTSLKK